MIQTKLFGWTGKRKIEVEGDAKERSTEEIPDASKVAAKCANDGLKNMELGQLEHCQLELKYLDSSWLAILQKELSKPYFIAVLIA
jgi:hypothetical protein